MRIESSEVENSKALCHSTLHEIPNLVVINGPNGSGKTSLFVAVRMFKEASANGTKLA